MHFSTRARIGLTFAVLALLLFGLVGTISARYANRQVANDTGDALLQLASRMSLALDSDMLERFREIHNLSRLQPLLTGQLQPAEWRTLVEQLQHSFSHYAWIGLAAADGEVKAATGGVLEGVSVRQRAWFQEACQAPFVGNVHEALLLASKLPPKPNGEPLRLVDVAAPLYRDGRLLGVLGAHLDLAWAEERRGAVLRGIQPDRKVELLVFDREGKTVLRSATQGDQPTGGLDRVLAGGPAVQTWTDGRSYLTAAIRNPPSSRYPDLGWTVVARQPADTALAAARGLQLQILLLGLLGAVLFGLAAWWLAGRVTAPLRRVAAQALALSSASSVAAGGRGQGGDEVAQLSTALGDLVTQLRKRELELVLLNQTLEQQVQERTAALELSNADLRSFSHSVSHDLKGPVGGIGAAVKMVLGRAGGSLDAATTKTLGLVVSECDRVRALTDELLTLALLEQHEITRVPVPMQLLVRTVVDDVRAQVAAGVAPGSPATRVEVGPLPDAVGDPVLLRQVWHNLIANAFKFSGRQALPVVSISAGHDTATDQQSYLVRDNGAGFDAQQASRLFGLFQRLHRASDFPGTGIGLSIVKRIVGRHGGRVWADSAPGAGATFGFSLATAGSTAAAGRRDAHLASHAAPHAAPHLAPPVA